MDLMHTYLIALDVIKMLVCFCLLRYCHMLIYTLSPFYDVVCTL